MNNKRKCTRCKKPLITRHQVKYCSSKCHARGIYDKSIVEWKKGIKSGTVGINSRILTSFLRRYLFEKYKSKCSICNWSEINKTSGRIPLEVDHIDGNSENNSEENLRLICPNCHALTPHFRNLNKGNGREWRKEKIRKSK